LIVPRDDRWEFLFEEGVAVPHLQKTVGCGLLRSDFLEASFRKDLEIRYELHSMREGTREGSWADTVPEPAPTEFSAALHETRALQQPEHGAHGSSRRTDRVLQLRGVLFRRATDQEVPEETSGDPGLAGLVEEITHPFLEIVDVRTHCVLL